MEIKTKGEREMKVLDIVRIVGPSTSASYPVNSRTLVDHYDNEDRAEKACRRANECRTYDDCGYSYVIEKHDEESPNRAMPIR